MNSNWGRVLPNTILVQIAGLVLVSLLLAAGIAFGIAIYQFRNVQEHDRPLNIAAEIAAVGRLAMAATSAQEQERVLEVGKSLGLHLRLVPISEMIMATQGAAFTPSFFESLVVKELQRANLVVLNLKTTPEGPDSVALRVGNRTAAVFDLPVDRKEISILHGPTLLIFAIVVAFLGVFSVYALRWITSPLRSFSDALEAFGEYPAEDIHLPETGPHEIAQAARAVNVMRKRIRQLLDERSYILVAISHDLRTPLTRLLLHAERLPSSPMRDAMLSDLSKIRGMISDTLTYSIAQGECDTSEQVDLPSLLQTISAEFTDTGHPVEYGGCYRFTYSCKAVDLARAVTNVVENAIRYGTRVSINFKVLCDGTPRIDVSDNGPGIPAEIRAKVFDPFFRGDSARASLPRGGFGLGLAIARDILANNGGTIHLLDNLPSGLTVRITLPCAQSGHDLCAHIS
jgi:signal transduction histidine kinase